MSKRQDIQDGTGRIEYISGLGTLQAWGRGAPTNSVSGFAPGCIYHNITGTSGTCFYVNTGTFSSSTWVNIDAVVAVGVTTPVAAVAVGYKIARGVLTTVTALDTVVTGLATVVSCQATLSSDPVDDPFMCTATIGDQAGTPAAGSILVKTWKNTGGTDPTPVAATTFSKLVNWFAIGT